MCEKLARLYGRGNNTICNVSPCAIPSHHNVRSLPICGLVKSHTIKRSNDCSWSLSRVVWKACSGFVGINRTWFHMCMFTVPSIVVGCGDVLRERERGDHHASTSGFSVRNSVWKRSREGSNAKGAIPSFSCIFAFTLSIDSVSL